MSSDIKLKWNGDHKQWITDFQDLLDNKRIGEVTDQDNKGKGKKNYINGLRHCCNTYVTCRPRNLLSRSG